MYTYKFEHYRGYRLSVCLGVVLPKRRLQHLLHTQHDLTTYSHTYSRKSIHPLNRLYKRALEKRQHHSPKYDSLVKITGYNTKKIVVQVIIIERVIKVIKR